MTFPKFVGLFNSGIDAEYSVNSVMGTAYNGAAINTGIKKFGTGSLDCSGNTARKYVQYSDAQNFQLVQTGCIRFWYRPGYSGLPSDFQTMLSLFDGTESLKNLIRIVHQPGGLVLYIKDKNGANLVVKNVGNWTPTAGTWYLFELNFDVTAGTTRLFIDGVQYGATYTETGVRDSSINVLQVGDNGYNTNFYIDEFIIWDTTRHTSNYTIPTSEFEDYPDKIQRCKIKGILCPVQALTISADLVTGLVKYRTKTMLFPERKETGVDVNGYWELNLIRGAQYKIYIGKYDKLITIPEKDEEWFFNL